MFYINVNNKKGIKQVKQQIKTYDREYCYYKEETSSCSVSAAISLFFGEHHSTNLAGYLTNWLDRVHVFELLIDNQEGGEEISK